MTSRRRADDGDRARALELHLAGQSYQQIADTLGFASKNSAHKLVQAALDELTAPIAAVTAGPQTTAIARLDAMLAGLWPKARRGDVQAIDRVLKIEERRLALEALNAAAQPAQAKKATGLSDFEKRLREREQRAKASRRTRTG